MKYVKHFENTSDFNKQYFADAKIKVVQTQNHGTLTFSGIVDGHYYRWSPESSNDEPLFTVTYNVENGGSIGSLDGYVDDIITSVSVIDNPNHYEEPWLSYTEGKGIDYNYSDPRLYRGGNVLDLTGAADNPNIMVINPEQLEYPYNTPPSSYQYYTLKSFVKKAFEGCDGYPIITTLLVDDSDVSSGHNTASFVSYSDDSYMYATNGTPWNITLGVGDDDDIHTSYNGD